MNKSTNTKKLFLTKIFLSTANSLAVNIAMLVGLFLTILGQLLICLGDLILPPKEFPLFSLLAIFAFEELFFIYFLRLYYNKKSPRLMKTLPFSKSFYTRTIPFFCQLFNTIFLLLEFLGIIICLCKGFNSSQFYLFLILFSFLYFFFSLYVPFGIRPVNSENDVYSQNQETRISWTVLIFIVPVFLCFLLIAILFKFYLPRLSAFFPELSFAGFGKFFLILLPLIILSCFLNRRLFLNFYKYR